MSDAPAFGRLLNAGGEIVAEGPCWLDEQARVATMEPERTPAVIQQQRGRLQLELDSGRLFPVSDKPMILRLRSWGGGPGQEQRRRLYRLRLLTWGNDDAQEAAAAGGAGEGSPASLPVSPRFGETPAAR